MSWLPAGSACRGSACSRGLMRGDVASRWVDSFDDGCGPVGARRASRRSPPEAQRRAGRLADVGGCAGRLEEFRFRILSQIVDDAAGKGREQEGNREIGQPSFPVRSHHQARRGSCRSAGRSGKRRVQRRRGMGKRVLSRGSGSRFPGLSPPRRISPRMITTATASRYSLALRARASHVTRMGAALRLVLGIQLAPRGSSAVLARPGRPRPAREAWSRCLALLGTAPVEVKSPMTRVVCKRGLRRIGPWRGTKSGYILLERLSAGGFSRLAADVDGSGSANGWSGHGEPQPSRGRQGSGLVVVSRIRRVPGPMLRMRPELNDPPTGGTARGFARLTRIPELLSWRRE